MTELTNFSDFYNKLPDKIKRSDILNDYEHAILELEETVLVMYETANNLPRTITGSALIEHHFTATTISKIVNEGESNTFQTIFKAAKNVYVISDEFMSLVSDSFEDVTVKQVIDYKKLHILKYIETLNFFNEYARQWLPVMLGIVSEDAQNNPTKYPGINAVSVTKDIIFKSSVAYISNYGLCEMFASILNLLMVTMEDFTKLIKPLEGHIYNSNDWGNGPITNNFRLDPFRLSARFVTTWNPIYQIGLIINGWRAARYSRNREELARLRLLVMSLEAQKTTITDPNRLESIKKQIIYHNNEINKCKMAIEKWEDKE